MAEDESPLFVQLVGTAFEHLAGAMPTVVTVGTSESDAGNYVGTHSIGDWFPWMVREVETCPDLPGALADELNVGPVLTIPPWHRRDGQKDHRNLNEHEVVLMDCIPPTPDSFLAAIVPADTLVSDRARTVRESLSKHWQIELVIYGTGVIPQVHRGFSVAAIFLRARQREVTPLRVFRISRPADNEDAIVDFHRLLKRNSGRGRFSYVLGQTPAPGESLAFDLNDPDLLKQKADLSGLGATIPLGEMFSLRRLLHLGSERNLFCSAGSPGAVRILSGRDLRRDGTIAPPDEDSRWAVVPIERQVRVGDILLRTIYAPEDKGGFVAVEVTEDDVPAVTSQVVIVLRAGEALDEAQRLLTLQFLRSPLARKLAGVSGEGVTQVRWSALSQLPTPQPDEALSTALRDLMDAAKRFEVWRSDARTLLQSIFLDKSINSARTRVVRSGRVLRLRSEAAASLDNYDYTVRTTFPYPVAYRWRGVEASVSAGILSSAYEAILETAEVLLCYLANLVLAFARESVIELGYTKNLRTILTAGRSGPGFGDWVAVLEEVRNGKAYRNLPDTHPLAELRSVLASLDADTARKAITGRRNDQAHLRRVDLAELPEAVDSALMELRTLLKSSSFLSDLPLVHITSVQWNSLQRRARVSYRELTGDHPVVPTRTMDYHANDLEVGSLYVMDSQHELHLLRPFLTGSDCPTCRTWSTFHIDRVTHGTPILKSLEHGHTIKDTSLLEAMRHVGLLESP